MSHTNSTANLSLPQFIGTDKPTWLSDVNGAFAAIDSYAGSNDAALAITDGKADTAIADASNAVTTAGNAATTAGNAAATATAANTVAGNALTVANGINAKVGVLTDLTTTDKSTVVNAINEVNGKNAADIPYDNTGSGLTATDVQAAIDEVAQGGGGGGSAWQLVGTETGAVAINIPASATDLYIEIEAPVGSPHEVLVFNIPVATLSANVRSYGSSWYYDSNSNVNAIIDITNASVVINQVTAKAVDTTSTSVITVYAK